MSDERYIKLLDILELIHAENVQLMRILLYIGINNRDIAEEMCIKTEEKWNEVYKDIRGRW